jgi:hypothetical protein
MSAGRQLSVWGAFNDSVESKTAVAIDKVAIASSPLMDEKALMEVYWLHTPARNGLDLEDRYCCK